MLKPIRRTGVLGIPLLFLLLSTDLVRAEGGRLDVNIASTPTAVIVDIVVLRQYVEEARKGGGQLLIFPYVYNKVLDVWDRVDESCYQRMQAAMRAIEPVVFPHRLTETVLRSDGDGLRMAAAEADRHDAARAEFRQAMKECVK